MFFCTICRDLLLNDHPEGPNSWKLDPTSLMVSFHPPKSNQSRQLKYHETIAELCENAEWCNLCKAVWLVCQTYSLTADQGFSYSKLRLTRQDRVYGFILTTSLGIDPTDSMFRGFDRERGLATISLRDMQPQIVNRIRDTTDQLESTGDEQGHDSQAEEIRELDRESCLLFLKDLVRECLDTHTDCPSNLETDLPTRLIDLAGAPNSIRLVDTKWTKGCYAALSYCWGKEDFITHQRSNAKHLMQGFPVSDLPICYREAIDITRQLGLRYLWIDSLCICQDDEDDWVRESARMAQVYSSSFVTLAAATGTGPSQPLQGRTPTERIAVFLHRDDETPGAASGMIAQVIHPRNDLSRFPYLYQDTSHPLDMRGWAAQEKWLSTRYFQFCGDLVQYQCAEKFTNNRGSTSKPRYLLRALNLHNQEMRPLSVWHWETLVQSYSQKQLTKISDKFPAISGLASIFSRELKSEYLAGHWHDDFVRSLLWVPDFLSNVSPLSSDAGLEPTSTPYIAPSWSWASSPVKVSFRKNRKAFTSVATIERTYISFRTDDIFGSLDGAAVTLKAPLAKLLLDVWTSPVARKYDIYGDHERFLITAEVSTGEVYEVTSTHSKKPQLRPKIVSVECHQAALAGILYAILLGDEVHRLSRRYLWLLITPTSVEDEYRRLGIFECELFDCTKIPEKEVTLI